MENIVSLGVLAGTSNSNCGQHARVSGSFPNYSMAGISNRASFGNESREVQGGSPCHATLTSNVCGVTMLMSRRRIGLTGAIRTSPFYLFVGVSAFCSRLPRMTSSMSVSADMIRKRFDGIRKSDEVLLLDGGTGEELFRRGVPDDRKIWSATACVNPAYHKILQDVHESFIAAGSQAITTNSYGIVPGVGFSKTEIAKHVATAGRIARASVQSESRSSSCEDGDKDRTTIVFGSLGPLVESYRPDKILPHDEGVEFYKIIARALAPNVDCFLAETMSSYDESAQAVQAVAGLGRPSATTLPMMVSYTLDSQGSIRDGEAPNQCIRRLLKFATNQHVELLGVLFNCAEPESISIALETTCSDTELMTTLKQHGVMLGAYANRLTPVSSDWTMADSNGPQPMRKDLDPARYYDEFVAKWIKDFGVQMVGGCCGITPEHISYLNSKLNPHK